MSLNQWHALYTTQAHKQFLEYLSWSQLKLYMQEQMEGTWLRNILFKSPDFKWVLLNN